MIQMQMVCVCPLCLKGGTRWRKKSRIGARHRKSGIQLGVQNINRRVFEDRFYREVGKQAQDGSNPQSLVCSRLEQSLFGRLIFTSSVGGLRKGSECLSVVVLLAIDIGLGQQILVIRRVTCSSSDCGKLGLRPGCVSEGEIVVGQSNSHLCVRSPRSPWRVEGMTAKVRNHALTEIRPLPR